MVVALKGRLSHADSRHYNNVQRLAYLLAILGIVLLVLLGLILWKSVQLATLREPLGGYEVAHRIHFCAMAGAVAFVVVHLVMVALVPRVPLIMLGGRVAGTSSPIRDRPSRDA